MPKLNVPGGALYYTVLGEGEPLVMLRGLGRSIRHWLGFEKLMAEHFRVICVDARGIGRSTVEVPWLLSMPDMASDVIRVLDKLNVSSSHVFGVSLGGMIAMSMGINYGERTKSLSIVNSSIGGQGESRMSYAAMSTILKGIVVSDGFHEKLAAVLAGSKSSPAHRKSLAQRWSKIEEQEGRQILTVVKQIGAALRFRSQADLSKISVPSLIISGLADKFVPPVQSEILHRLIPGSQLVHIENGGHEITDDCPEEVIKAVRNFIGGKKNRK